MGSTVLWGSELAKSLNDQRPDELYHFGIKGMRWGVRRFQRRDGSRTKAGLRREKTGRASWKRKESKQLTEEELRERIRRLQTERQYEDLMESRGMRDFKNSARNIADSAAGKVIGTVIAGAGLYAAEKALTKFRGSDTAAKILEYGKKGSRKR